MGNVSPVLLGLYIIYIRRLPVTWQKDTPDVWYTSDDHQRAGQLNQCIQSHTEGVVDDNGLRFRQARTVECKYLELNSRIDYSAFKSG